MKATKTNVKTTCSVCGRMTQTYMAQGVTFVCVHNPVVGFHTVCRGSKSEVAKLR